MELIISRNELNDRLSSVEKVINSKTSVPLLENFLFKIDEDSLTILATDLETTLTTTMPLEHKSGKMSLAVPTKLSEILKELPEQLLNISINEETYEITLKSDNKNYSGKFTGFSVGENGEDFPKAKELDEAHKSFEIPSEVLINGIVKTSFAAATEEARPAMTGILFDIFTDKLTFVATDAHKLVRYNVLKQSHEFEDSFILPRKPAAYLKDILPKSAEETVKISFDDKNVYFDTPEYSVKCRRIEGRFPNYNAVIQQNNPLKLIVDRESLFKAVKRVKVFASESTGLLKFELSENQIKLSAQDLDFSTSAEENIACQYSDEALTIGFKAALLEELLKNIECSQVQMELADSSKAGIIVPFENAENEELLMLLMPMFLN
ncbi:MAG: DNA polymerase III subunit beta [Prevotellaceae bacterium]|jgi:DNA polymerase-3 subunit beta|nr:DNA polymerase III subunit beta [Prevotellaceae bacterium]